MSRQTLYRRLRAEGTTFEEILDAKRRQLAIRYLGLDRSSVKAAAYRLGFSDPAAFSRAFKRWTGRSPSEFREAKIWMLARPVGFEPTTSSLEGSCSIQLSYGRVDQRPSFIASAAQSLHSFCVQWRRLIQLQG